MQSIKVDTKPRPSPSLLNWFNDNDVCCKNKMTFDYDTTQKYWLNFDFNHPISPENENIHITSLVAAEVGAQINNFNAQAQIVQPEFLIVKTQAQIAQAKNKIVKAQVQIAQVKNKIGKAQAQIAQVKNKIGKVQAQIAKLFSKI